MSEVPTPVSESTAAEIVRTEGSTRSFKSVDNTIVSSDLIMLNASGAVKATSGSVTEYLGCTIYTAGSGQRVVVERGKMRATWDGASTTLAAGAPIGISVTHSGWFEGSSLTSGANVIGYNVTNLAATQSGTLQIVSLL